MLIKTVAIYNRISRDNNESEDVLLNHRKLLKDYANQNHISTSYMKRLNREASLKREKSYYNYLRILHKACMMD